jgi:hypothetical protein
MLHRRLFVLCLALVAASIALTRILSATAPAVPGATSRDARLNCDLAAYKPAAGLTASIVQDALVVSWDGQGGTELRARFAIDDSAPVVRELSVRRQGGTWAAIGQNLTPEYHVTTGIRRMADDQGRALDGLGIQITQDVIDKHRWYAFWDAPLVVPGTTESQTQAAERAQGSSTPAPSPGGATPLVSARGQLPVPAGRVYDLPRTPQEIHRDRATFKTSSCAVKTDGGSLAVTFPGLSMGMFSGSLRFTIYRGANLFQMDAIATTSSPWVAYKYDAGLSGFTTTLTPAVKWHDSGGRVQEYRFGGPIAKTMSGLKAANRIVVAEGKGGSLAAFTPPHTFFFTREKDTNLGYVWYRKDADTKFGIGIRMPEAEEDPQYALNFALYNAPPGTAQRMTVFFYASAAAAEPTREAALAFTHGDTFKPVAGYKTFVNHFHLAFTDRQRAQGFDSPLQDLVAMKALGLNIIGLSDFHFELHANDPGALRLTDQRDYFEASRRASDTDFLVTPWEEPSVFFGGHYNVMFPKDVYWSKVRRAGQPFTETDPSYGKVYHTGSAADLQQLMDAEGAYWYTAHPRTKLSAGYPDAYFDRDYAKSDRYLGVAFKPGMGMDLSETTLCAYRCFDAVDTMNNMYAGSGLRPKYVIADIDTYRKGPEDDLYPNFPVNYLKLDRVPGPDEDWSPILRAMHDGDFFVTTGEILIRNYAVTGTGARRTISADAEWTFPLSFVEIVWGDGKNVDRKIVPATDLAPFGSRHFSFDFEATGKAWVRFAIWDVAGDGAFVQPVWLKGS